MKSNFQTGFLEQYRQGVRPNDDQKSINQNQRNDFNEGNAGRGTPVGHDHHRGVTIAGRVYGMALQGDRLLGTTTEPLFRQRRHPGVRGLLRAVLRQRSGGRHRSNFEKKYLDFKRNSNGLIDTVGLDEDDKVVNELETTDALSYELENNFRFGRVGFMTRLTRHDRRHWIMPRAGWASGRGNRT